MRKLILSNAILLSVVMSSFSCAQDSPSIEINLRSGFFDTGRALDRMPLSAVPLSVAVAEDEREGDEQLTLTVNSFTSSSSNPLLDTAASNTLGFGVNSGGFSVNDSSTSFDANFDESVVFSFSQDLFIQAVDLESLSGVGFFNDEFQVGEILINDSQTGSNDVFSFINSDNPSGLFVSAGETVLFRANDGAVALQTITVQIASTLTGDFDGDGDVDADDIDFYSGNLDLPAADDLAQLDLTGDGFVTIADHDLHVTTLVQTSNGIVGTAIGDINLDGQVDVLGDAFILVGSLGSNDVGWGTGDLNADQTTNVLGDAFLLVGNLGASNDAAAAAAP